MPIRAGEIFLLPARVPHNPMRTENSVGLVIERKRREGEMDGLLWFCDNCNHKLFESYFPLTNIENDFQKVFKEFYGSLEHRTCNQCGSVLEPPAKPV